MKIGICAVIKNENLYLREWVEHHKNLGFDKIILYDNNHPEGEYPHQVIGDYIMDGFVEVHNVRGYQFLFDVAGAGFSIQTICYNKCRMEYQNEIDWMAFIDADEFITIGENEPQNIHEIFVKYDYVGKGAKQILMSWYNIGSDGALDYEEGYVQDRFKQHVIPKQAVNICDAWVKSIVETHVPEKYGFSRGNGHAIPHIHSCVEDDVKVIPDKYGDQKVLKHPQHNILYIKHYVTKSLWEHLVRRSMRKDNVDARLLDYKMLNGWSNEHQKILDKFIEYVDNVEDISVNVKIKRKA